MTPLPDPEPHRLPALVERDALMHHPGPEFAEGEPAVRLYRAAERLGGRVVVRPVVRVGEVRAESLEPRRLHQPAVGPRELIRAGIGDTGDYLAAQFQVPADGFRHHSALG